MVRGMALSSRTPLTELAEAFHALSDPTRLQIVELLRDGEECVCELADKVGAAQSRLSFHLKTLKDAGVLKDRRDGRWVYYSVNADLLAELTEVLATVRARAAKASTCCS